VPSHAVTWREWDGEFVVRNERTGSTHLLGPLAGRVLGLLLDAGGPLEAAEIAAKLDEAFPATRCCGQADAIAETLAEFHRLGLAELETQ
jgi:PqqD family protein of HPr-rel-A system